MKVSAGIDIRVCFFGCDSFTVDIARAEGQLFTPEPKPDMSDTPGQGSWVSSTSFWAL